MRRCLCRWFLLVSPEGAMVFPLCLNGAFAGVTSVFMSVLMSGLFLDFSRGREGCPRKSFNEGGKVVLGVFVGAGPLRPSIPQPPRSTASPLGG